MKKKVNLNDVKQALMDHRFRDSLPITFQDDIVAFLKNPSCACNAPFYRKIIKDCRKELKEYFPSRPISNMEEEIKQIAKNNWRVINCHSKDLEKQLRSLPTGRKQIAIARYEDQVTVVINELDIIY